MSTPESRMLWPSKTRRGHLAALPDYLKPPMTFAYSTGWRSSEVLGLKWANIDFRAEEIRLEVKSGVEEVSSR